MEWGLGRSPTMQTAIGQRADLLRFAKKEKAPPLSALVVILVLLFRLRNRL